MATFLKKILVIDLRYEILAIGGNVSDHEEEYSSKHLPTMSQEVRLLV